MPDILRHDFLRLLPVILSLTLCSGAALAQELTPRAYWPAPSGTNVAGAAYQLSTGDIIVDPSLPVVGVDSNINYLSLTYQRTFGLFNRTASLQLNLPYTWGTTEGTVDDEFLRRDIDTFADLRTRFSLNLVGAPEMSPDQFKALVAEPQTLVGVSLLVQAPTGAYQSDKVINAGTNRWSVKPAVGAIWPLAPRWFLEAELGAWLYSDNTDFLGQTKKQDPIVSTEFHLVNIIRPGVWGSLDLNYYVGGKTQVEDQAKADLQRNSRFGATLVFPLDKRSLIRASYSTGVVTKTGTDFSMFAIAYLFAWR
jgi:hypothetical protein